MNRAHLVVFLSALLVISACGGGEIDGNLALPDPVKIFPVEHEHGKVKVCGAEGYVGKKCSDMEIRGNLPGMTWTAGSALTEAEVFANLDYKCGTFSWTTPGVYDFTYVCKSQSEVYWADYGIVDGQTGKTEKLFQIAPRGLGYVWADWFNSNQNCVSSGKTTDLRVRINNDLSVSPAGNLSEYSEKTPDCK